MSSLISPSRAWSGLAAGVNGLPLLLVLVLLTGSGCVSTRSFVPAEHVTALSPRGGHYAAEYTIRDASHSIAEVKVWSRGASRNGSNGATVVHVAFEVENVGDAPVRLDPKQVFLDGVALSDGERDRIPPAHFDGDPVVPAEQERHFDVSFELPDDVWPSDVLGYRVSWQLRNGGSYSQKTPFLRAVDGRYADPIYPYDAPSYGLHIGVGYAWPYTYRARPYWRYRPYYPGLPYRRYR